MVLEGNKECWFLFVLDLSIGNFITCWPSPCWFPLNLAYWSKGHVCVHAMLRSHNVEQVIIPGLSYKSGYLHLEFILQGILKKISLFLHFSIRKSSHTKHWYDYSADFNFCYSLLCTLPSPTVTTIKILLISLSCTCLLGCFEISP